jgi:hypothetical protein
LNNPLKYADPSGWLIDKYFDLKGNYLGDDGIGNDIRIMDRDHFNMLTDFGRENLTDLECILKQSSTLFSDYINYDGRSRGLQEEFQLKIYQHFNPTGLRLENYDHKGVGNMGFAHGEKRIMQPFIRIDLLENLKGGLVNNYDNVINMFEHENQHRIDYKQFGHEQYMKIKKTDENFLDQKAIKYQMNHSSWKNTSEYFKKGIKNYGISKGMSF